MTQNITKQFNVQDLMDLSDSNSVEGLETVENSFEMIEDGFQYYNLYFKDLSDGKVYYADYCFCDEGLDSSSWFGSVPAEDHKDGLYPCSEMELVTETVEVTKYVPVQL